MMCLVVQSLQDFASFYFRLSQSKMADFAAAFLKKSRCMLQCF